MNQHPQRGTSELLTLLAMVLVIVSQLLPLTRGQSVSVLGWSIAGVALVMGLAAGARFVRSRRRSTAGLTSAE
ncbi:hypothetical protein [Luteococcus sp. OSA5]|uniref:hypothetical protein n=1 Tax=Luteococcus sp. OSA5 TaxID=3401630 RepID=UPI003B42AD2D